VALLVGADPWRLLTQTDPLESAILQMALARAIELQEIRDQNLAIRIANAVGKALS
jgi:hypothetical protein